MNVDSQSAAEFVGILTSHQDAIRIYIMTRIPGHADVMDILQEVNITLWEKRSEFEPNSNFTSWAYKVAHFKLLNHLKKLRSSKELVFGDDLELLINKEITATTPNEITVEIHTLRFCLSQLKPRHQELIAARYSGNPEDMRVFSEKISRSRGSLRVTLSRLRAVLRECINLQILKEERSL